MPTNTEPNSSSPASGSTARGYALVLLAASLWATLGVIYHFLARTYGMPPLAVAGLRAGLGGVILLIGLLALRRSWLRIDRRAARVVLVYGVVGIAFFYAAYINAILTVGVAVSAVLLYTAPAWVALLAWRFLGEQLTRTHLIALTLTLAGSALVAQIYQPGLLRVNALGILWGLLSGFSYALWSVFNKVGVRHTNPWTLQCYGMLVGSAALLLFQPLAPLAGALQDPGAAVWLLLLALGPTVGASVAYAAGVRTVPVSVASLIATLEPVLAALLAFLVLGETLGLGQIAGGALILLAVWLLRPRASRT
ncbi:MAG TPA: DMT family transporter [Anaerolineae bacterium]|nr:DMT family transporter [Anaerolineae bacterium]HNU05047.1 DMT family transporter [Anaerolineae bacterium]